MMYCALYDKCVLEIYRRNYISLKLFNRWNNISLKRDIAGKLRCLVDISPERYITATIYLWNEIPQESSDISSIYRFEVSIKCKIDR